MKKPTFSKTIFFHVTPSRFTGVKLKGFKYNRHTYNNG
jgi:hypothetical protein